MKEKFRKVLPAIAGVGAVMVTGFTAFAEDGGVSSIITATATSLKADATTVITSAVGVGVVFFGAKLLWSKFKSMAK